MELKFVIPNMEKTFGNLEFAGEDKVVQRRINGRLTVLSRSYNLYSDVQRADDIVVVLPAEAGEKHFGFEERVKLVNPRITAEGYKIGTRGFTNYLLHADDMIFSNGYVEQSISLEKQLNIIQVADLVLPDKETSFEEYTTMELLSVAMLIVISTFALDFIHTDRSIFKIVDLDEAWSFLQVAQGKTLSMKLVRAGRAMNAGVYFVTQNTDDLLDEKLKNNLGLKFAFRSTDLNEIKKTLAFFGVDPEDENNQKRLRDLENGQCLISDLYGRVGVIQFHPVFEELLHAFDTRPPVRKEV